MAMPPKRKQRLMIVLSIVIGASIAAGLIFYALSDNLDLFSPPSDIVAGKVPVGKQMRAGGMVEKGSVVREKDSLTVRFNITDYQETVTVSYTGILPDLFSEDAGVVVTGVLQEDGTIKASEVLAKHDENYMPPEVAATLKKQHSPESTGMPEATGIPETAPSTATATTAE